MSRVCDLTGVKPLSGNTVSHSNRKLKTRFLPNLHIVNLKSNVLNSQIKLRITAKTLRTIDIKGGLDNYLLSRSHNQLTSKAKVLRKRINNTLDKNKQD